MKRIVYLTIEEERELSQRALDGDTDARNRVVMNIYPWICRRAHRYEKIVAYEDLINHAVALCLEKFHLLDLSIPSRPMTYLTNVADRQMQLMCARNGVIVQPRITPRNSEATKRKAEAVKRVMSVSQSISETADGDVFEVGEILAEKRPTPPEATISNEGVERFYAMLRWLPTEREREILAMRIVGDKTLVEVGDCIGISKERVRQIEELALKRIRLGVLSRWAITA